MIKAQFLKFILIGIFSTIVNYSTFYALYEFLNLYYILSSALGFIVGVFAGYSFNKNWTFRVRDKSKAYVFKYYLVYIFSLFAGLAFLEFLVKVLSLDPRLANLMTIGLTTCTNFIGTKIWVFRK